jgi:hypothetical protein
MARERVIWLRLSAHVVPLRLWTVFVLTGLLSTACHSNEFWSDSELNCSLVFHIRQLQSRGLVEFDWSLVQLFSEFVVQLPH